MAQRTYTYDINLLFKDAGALTTSVAWQVSAANKIVDTNNGATGNPSRWDAVMVVDVSAIDVVTGDEFYHLLVQGSNSASFASGIHNMGGLFLGGASVSGIPTVSTIGRFEIQFSNEQNNVLYRYLRGFLVTGGTTPSINFTAFAAINFADL